MKQQAARSVSWLNETRPPFEFEDVNSRLAKAKIELVDLKSKIAHANTRTMVEGKSLQQLVFELSEVKDDITFIEGLSAGAQKEITTEEKDWDYDMVTNQRVQKVTKTTHHYVFDEKGKEAVLDKLRARAAELNQALERHNHLTEL
jgi:hypothetical protein